MTDIRNKFIENSKLAVDQLIKIVGAEFDFEKIGNSTKGRKALRVKKKAFIQAKKIIQGILESDYKQQTWGRKVVTELIVKGTSSIESLVDALNDSINVDTIANNADDLMSAIDAKGVAFEDVQELIEHVDELKRVVEEDEIILKEVEYDQGYPEIYADKYIKKKNKSGYAPGIDAVILDPDGSVGEIIVISDLRIALPKKPMRKDVAHQERKKPDQYWRRIAPPVGLNKRSAKRYTAYIDEEYNNRHKGYWFFNNGAAEYITGAHWFHMTHCKTGADGGYYWFGKAQQKLFLFMEAVWCDKRCGGLILEKIRRLGATDMFMAFSLCKSLTERDKIFGMTSKINGDAVKNFKRQTNMFANLPFYFKPICIDEKSATKLDFNSPAQKLTKKNKNNERVDNSLNTYLGFESTSESSYDGDGLRLYLADEFSKWKKQNGNTTAHFEMVRKSATKGARITGKLFLFSTIENVTGKDADDDDALAGDRYKQIYYDSDVNKRNANGQTKSYLYKIFLSVHEHYEGFIDRYGYSILEDPKSPMKNMEGEIISIGIRTHIANELKPFEGNTRAIIEYKRKSPIEEEDGFAVADGTCMFNQANLITQISANDHAPHNENKLDSRLRRGNFKWLGGKRDCGVVLWADDPDGRFLIAWMPPKELRNNNIRRNNVLYPGNAHIGAFGLDPYKTDKNKKGSKGAIHGCTRQNNVIKNHFFFLEYVHRPEKRSIFIEDSIMAMVFFGMPCLVENNVRNQVEAMRKRGYRKFSLNRPDKPLDKLTDDEKKYGGMPSTSENVIQMQTSAIETYVDLYVGEIEDNVYGAMYFNKTLLDWLSYDPKNRTKRDASISSSLALLACGSVIKKVNTEKHDKAVVDKMVKRHNNNKYQ